MKSQGHNHKHDDEPYLSFPLHLPQENRLLSLPFPHTIVKHPDNELMDNHMQLQKPREHLYHDILLINKYYLPYRNQTTTNYNPSENLSHPNLLSIDFPQQYKHHTILQNHASHPHQSLLPDGNKTSHIHYLDHFLDTPLYKISLPQMKLFLVQIHY